MSENPPEGSKVQIQPKDGEVLIVSPRPGAGPLKYVYLIGLALFGWFGYPSISEQVRKNLAADGNDIPIMWFVVLIVVAAYMVLYMVRLFSPTVAETFLLDKPYLTVDSGIPPVRFRRLRGAGEQWWNLFPRRRKYRFDTTDLKSLDLRDTDQGNRITIDQNNERVDIGSSLSQPEKAWLFRYLQQNYR